MALGGILEGLGAALQFWGNNYQENKNRQAQLQMNQANIDAAKQAYLVQRKDALADWDKQNAYNSPAQQMERLRQAGLNPNLVYGKGADNVSGSIRSSNMEVPHQQAYAKKVDFSPIGGMVNQYYELKKMKAETDNLALMKVTLEKDAALKDSELRKKDAETLKTISENDRTKWDTQRSKDLFDLEKQRIQTEIEGRQASAEMSRTQTARIKQATAIDLSDSELRHIKDARSEREAVQRILLSRAQQLKIEQDMLLNAPTGENNVGYKEKKERLELIKKQQDQITAAIAHMDIKNVDAVGGDIFKDGPFWAVKTAGKIIQLWRAEHK